MAKIPFAKTVVIGAFGLISAKLGAQQMEQGSQLDNSVGISAQLNAKTAEFSAFCQNLITDYIADIADTGKKMVQTIQGAKKKGTAAKRKTLSSFGLPFSSYCVRFGLTLQQKVQQNNSLFQPFAYFNPTYSSCLKVRDEFFALSKECHLDKPQKQHVLTYLKKAKPYSFFRVLVNSSTSNSGLHYVTVISKLDENRQQLYHADGTPRFIAISANGEHFCDAENYFVGGQARGYVEESTAIATNRLAQAYEKGEINDQVVSEYNQKHDLNIDHMMAPFAIQEVENSALPSQQNIKGTEGGPVAVNIQEHMQNVRQRIVKYGQKPTINQDLAMMKRMQDNLKGRS